MEKFTLINKDRSRIKVFEPFEDVSKPSPSIDSMMITYGCVYKRANGGLAEIVYLQKNLKKNQK